MSTALPELVSYLEGLPEPHILFDRQYRILAANAAYRRQFSPQASVVGRTCYEVSHHFSVPCDQAGESCPLARARESGQRERVLHLHHTPQGESYVNIELVPLRDAAGEQAYFIEKMEPLRVAHGQPAAQGLIGRSPAFQHMLELVARVGPSSASVLLLGESGTGKELVARAVHEASPRAASTAGGGGLRQPARDAVRERTVRPRARRVHRRQHQQGQVWSKPPAAARCSSTRWATFRCRCRSSCCGCWKAAPTGAWAAPNCAEPMCAWWRPRTATCRRWWPTAASARTCTTG